jgi:hypothetical protein
MSRLNSDNCMACSEEFSFEELCSLVSAASHYRICQRCLDASDPANDYKQVKNIILGYVKFAQQISDPGVGFVGNESPAEAETNTMKNKLDNYYNTLK